MKEPRGSSIQPISVSSRVQGFVAMLAVGRCAASRLLMAAPTMVGTSHVDDQYIVTDQNINHDLDCWYAITQRPVGICLRNIRRRHCAVCQWLRGLARKCRWRIKHRRRPRRVGSWERRTERTDLLPCPSDASMLTAAKRCAITNAGRSNAVKYAFSAAADRRFPESHARSTI